MVLVTQKLRPRCALWPRRINETVGTAGLTMRRRLIYIALTLSVAVVLVVGQRLTGDAELTVADGRRLYDRMCALCHGAQGQGYAAPAATALANVNFLAVAGDTYLYVNTARGRPGTRMSAWGDAYGGPLTESEIAVIVDYMRSWQSAPSVDVTGVDVEGDLDRGAAIYAANCAVCHGPTGGGRLESPAAPNGAPSLDNPVFLDTASDGFIRYSISAGRPGTLMPAYGTSLTDGQISDLVEFIRSWQS
jgi:cytochrome c oxidase cbb3-type subunit 3